MRTFFVTYLGGKGKSPEQADWAEVHAETIGQVDQVAANHGWRVMSVHDTACWRFKLRVETARQLELLEWDRFLHYHRRGGREDPAWLNLVRQRSQALREAPNVRT